MRWPLLACSALFASGCARASMPVEPLHNVGVHTDVTARPTLEEAQATIDELGRAEPYLQDELDSDDEAALALLGLPFWFEGFDYASFKADSVRVPCKQRSGTLTSRQDLEAFAQCLRIASWTHSGGTLDEMDATHLPSVFAAQRDRILDLSRDHTLAFSHFCPAAPGDFWTVYGATKHASGSVTVDMILVANDEEGDCRFEEAEAAKVP